MGKSKLLRVFKIALSVVIALSIVFVFLFLLSNIMESLPEPRMFTDLSAFAKLEVYADDSTNIVDSTIIGLECESSYCKSIVYKDNRYQVFAYVFSEQETALQYFTNETGSEVFSIWNESLTGDNLYHTTYVIYYENYLYKISGGNRLSTVEFINWLNADFSIDLNSISPKNV